MTITSCPVYRGCPYFRGSYGILLELTFVLISRSLTGICFRARTPYLWSREVIAKLKAIFPPALCNIEKNRLAADATNIIKHDGSFGKSVRNASIPGHGSAYRHWRWTLYSERGEGEVLICFRQVGVPERGEGEG